MVVYVPNSIGSGSNAPTLFWSVPAPLSPLLACLLVLFSGSMVDHSRAVLRVILQSMALASPPRPNPSSRSFNTGLVL